MTTLQGSAQKQLRQLIEQIERLEEEKRALAADIRDKYAEAKGQGFDVKVMRAVVSLRKKAASERQEHESVLAVYMHALGMADDFEAQAAAYDVRHAEAHKDGAICKDPTGSTCAAAEEAEGQSTSRPASVAKLRDYNPVQRAQYYQVRSGEPLF